MEKMSCYPESYVRMLEVEVVALKLKLAQAQTQIDEQKLLANKEHATLQCFQLDLQRKNHNLEVENASLRNELQEERTKSNDIAWKCNEENMVMLQLKQNV